MLAASLVMAAGAGGCNAISSVLQRKANLAEPAERSGVRLIGDLVRRGPWLLSILAMIVSFLLQAAALDVGTLAAVEPVLAIELPLTLVFAAWLLHRPLRRRAMVAGAVMAAGLAAFVVGLDPSDGDAARVGNAPALLALVGTGALIAPMSVIARLGPAGSRAALFGVAAGACFGLTASLVKMAVARLSSGGVAGLLRPGPPIRSSSRESPPCCSSRPRCTPAPWWPCSRG
jgi:drug/metabolite transporter (DMT)-like permease